MCLLPLCRMHTHVFSLRMSNMHWALSIWYQHMISSHIMWMHWAQDMISRHDMSRTWDVLISYLDIPHDMAHDMAHSHMRCLDIMSWYQDISRIYICIERKTWYQDMICLAGYQDMISRHIMYMISTHVCWFPYVYEYLYIHSIYICTQTCLCIYL